MANVIDRRQFLSGSGALLLLGSLPGCQLTPPVRGAPRLELAPLRASVDRITRITVCTRPFRAKGPRFDVEQLSGKTVVHNYGHGGSGWSLSWGSAAIVTAKAMATGERDMAVIGCGALGLTAALQLQRAGARVTIYAKELPPNVRSSLASGLWTPDSRICLQDEATAQFKTLWEQMTRESFQTFQSFLGLPGTPVEFIDTYSVTDQKDAQLRQPAPDRPAFAELQRELVPDLVPQNHEFGPGSHSLGPRYLHRNSLMMFNLSAYTRTLLGEFAANGGKIEITEFHTPADLARLREKTLVNCTGYGARQLFSDTSVTPVRGQLARLMPQPEVNYGLFYKRVSFVPRRDGLVVQAVGENDYYGFNDPTALPDRAEAESAVATIASLFAGA
jgi:glycine/D-amino acid oxidase-like deaminating enzyme